MPPLRIFYAIPSANPGRAQETLRRWKERGYQTAVLLDPGAPKIEADFVTWAVPSYPGYFPAMNDLTRVLQPLADIVVFGGDDMFPDPTQDAQQIGAKFVERFPDFLGVLQPIGDQGIPGVETICGSPWVGREFLRRAYEGKGPWWGGYRAYYGDQEMKEVAEKLGCLWMEKSLTQHHAHFSRPGGMPKMPYQVQNEQRHWHPDKALFYQRRAAGFPGHALLPA
jgi:hypothetical protein